MLTTKYYEEFLRGCKDVINKKQIVAEIMRTEINTGVEILDWDEIQLGEYLSTYSSVSVAGIDKNIKVLRMFADFICNHEKLILRNYKKSEDSLYYVDKDRLKTRVINYMQYLDIKTQLNVKDENNNRINVRDSVIFELAWTGLMREEIQNIKKEDITFVETDMGTIIKLKLVTRTIEINDPYVVEDIKLCLNETHCMKQGVHKKLNSYEYRDFSYLIKPINVGKRSKKGNITNLSITFSHILESNNITCENIDIGKLGLNDIRRSKIIYLLAPENEDIFDTNAILKMFNLSSPNSLTWLREIARDVYNAIA